jgi:hypothetical protein
MADADQPVRRDQLDGDGVNAIRALERAGSDKILLGSGETLPLGASERLLGGADGLAAARLDLHED